jgi:hypothetical protein
MAIGPQTFSSLGAGVSDIFAGFGDNAKASGDFAEAREYSLAAGLATQNEKFTETSTAIKEAQQQRELTQSIGGQQADVASAGFSEGGSALDLMRDSAAQGALTHAVMGQQGLITEAGYTEQAQSYADMSAAATAAGNAANNAGIFSDITGGIKLVAGLASMFTGEGEVAAVVGGAAKSAMGDATGIGGLY